MSWGARLKAALSGDVSGADVAAMLAATAPLGALEQELANRRLSAEIDNAGHEWRVCMALAPIAAPLWMGEALVALAQSLVEAEADDHPDRPSDLSPIVHDVAATVLQPVNVVISEVSAALVDPARPSGLTAPLTVGPRGAVAPYTLPYPVPSPYARGLLLAAKRIQGSAQVALTDTESLVERSPAPAWLTAALRRVGGESRATGARLEMIETQLLPVLRAPHADNQTLAALCDGLWDALNTALVDGQLLREPHLLPGAPPPQSYAPPASQPVPPSAPRFSPTPPDAPRPSWPSPPEQPWGQPSAPPPPMRAAPEPAPALPDIGDGVRAAPAPMPGPPHQPSPPPAQPATEEWSPALPQIGEDIARPDAEPRQRAPHRPSRDASERHDEPSPFQLPRIGSDA